MLALIDKKLWNRFKQNKGAFLGLILIVVLCLIAFAAPLLAPHDPHKLFSETRVPPFWSTSNVDGFYFGTDDVGRDLLSRLIYGARVSLAIGFFVVLFSAFIGTTLGLIAGYFGGKTDKIIMRFIDLIMALPSILLAIIVVSVLGPNLINSVIAVSIVAIPSFVRLIRAAVINEKAKDYVAANWSLGAKHFRTLVINILPNCLAPLIVQSSLGFSEAILSAAALGFLGLGAQPPTAEWGTMLADARPFIESSPWLVTFPGLCILVVVLAFNLFGDGLRDALDPKLRR